MRFQKLVRDKAHVQTIYQKPNADGHMESFDITAHEAPHPEMDKALEALAPVVVSVKELASVQTVEPYGISISYTKKGTRKCSILFTRKLECTGETYKEKTPAFQFDEPSEGEERPMECSTGDAQCIRDVISEGIRYAGGERQQMLLPLDENKEPGTGAPVEDDDGDDLGFLDEEKTEE